MVNDKLGRLRLDTLNDIANQTQPRFIGITAKYRSKCYICERWMPEGSTILWSPEESIVKHFSKKACYPQRKPKKKRRKHTGRVGRNPNGGRAWVVR